MMNRIQNSKFKIQNFSEGYTLVELLAVTSILVLVSGLIVGILYSTLRGGNKTKATNDVAQNGNFALSIISNTALLAGSVTEVNGTPITDCTGSAENIANFPLNPDGYPSGTSIEFEQTNGSVVSFSCESDSIASSSAIIAQPNYLIDNNSVKIDSTTCTFSCFQPDNNPYAQPIINISFTVSQKLGTVFENTASSSFDTSVTMRNYSPR